MFVRWLLFHTKIGELLLVFLETRVNLAVVDADWLGCQRTGVPTAMSEAE